MPGPVLGKMVRAGISKDCFIHRLDPGVTKQMNPQGGMEQTEIHMHLDI